MKLLLISDPETDKASAAMDINIGRCLNSNWTLKQMWFTERPSSNSAQKTAPWKSACLEIWGSSNQISLLVLVAMLNFVSAPIIQGKY
jgi:hypothetical protein